MAEPSSPVRIARRITGGTKRAWMRARRRLAFPRYRDVELSCGVTVNADMRHHNWERLADYR